MIGAATRFASAREVWELMEGVERETIGRKFSGAINDSISVSFLFFIAGTVSTHFALSGMSFRDAVQKGKALSKDYQATVTNCPTRT